jgi:hypothetical protein
LPEVQRGPGTPVEKVSVTSSRTQIISFMCAGLGQLGESHRTMGAECGVGSWVVVDLTFSCTEENPRPLTLAEKGKCVHVSSLPMWSSKLMAPYKPRSKDSPTPFLFVCLSVCARLRVGSDWAHCDGRSCQLVYHSLAVLWLCSLSVLQGRVL